MRRMVNNIYRLIYKVERLKRFEWSRCWIERYRIISLCVNMPPDKQSRYAKSVLGLALLHRDDYAPGQETIRKVATSGPAPRHSVSSVRVPAKSKLLDVITMSFCGHPLRNSRNNHLVA